MRPFSYNWTFNNSVLRGYYLGAFFDGELGFPVSFPGRTTVSQRVSLSTSARETNTLETVQNLKLYLIGSDAELVTGVWSLLGRQVTPERPELAGGFEISFDDGHSYHRMGLCPLCTQQGPDVYHGLLADPATWLLVPSAATGSSVDGVLGPFDVARFVVRYKVPPAITDFKALDVRLACSGDIV